MGWPHVQVLTAPRPTESIMKRIAVGYSQLPTSDTSREQMPVRPQCVTPAAPVPNPPRAPAPTSTFLSFTQYFSVLTSNFQHMVHCKAELLFRNDCPVSGATPLTVGTPPHTADLSAECMRPVPQARPLPPRNAMASMTSILAIGNNPCLRRSGHGAVLVIASTVARDTRGICSRLEAEVLKVVSISSFHE